MKPARGSTRPSTQGPKGGGRGDRRLQQQSQKPLPNDGSAQDKSRKSSVAAETRKDRKRKGQENWKPLDKSSISAIDNMLGLSILSVLTMRRKEKEESQKHLNLLKDQFLAKCAQLPVPPRKSGNMMQASRQFQAESQKIKHGKKKMEAYEESSKEVVSKLEQLQGKRDSLEDKCRIMRDKLEDEEENAKEFTQMSEQAVLHLPALPACRDDEPTLQEQMMKMVPNPKAVMKTLQNSKVMGHVNTFLELAHKQADELLTHPLTTDIGDIVV
ncbi:centromere protein Q [Salminus brasiliensis]|uniref:centromere protein Q n=1 Tax=Salminus brasiliensis TaxID=930266 RepID=UPI003B82F94F